MPPDRWGDDSDGIAIAKNNAHWRQGNREDDRIGLQHNATLTMMTTTKRADDQDKKDPPKGGIICKEGQGEEEGLASAEEVRCAAIQVDDVNTAFLLMVEAMVATATASLLLLGVGTTTIILELLLP